MSPGDQFAVVKSTGAATVRLPIDSGIILVPRSMANSKDGTEFAIRYSTSKSGAGENLAAGVGDALDGFFTLETAKGVGVRLLAPVGGCVAGGIIGFFVAGPPGTAVGCGLGADAAIAVVTADAIVQSGKAVYRAGEAAYQTSATDGVERHYWQRRLGQELGGIGIAALLHKASKVKIRRAEGKVELEIPKALQDGKTLNLVKIGELPDGTLVFGTAEIAAATAKIAAESVKPANTQAALPPVPKPALRVMRPTEVAVLPRMNSQRSLPFTRTPLYYPEPHDEAPRSHPQSKPIDLQLMAQDVIAESRQKRQLSIDLEPRSTPKLDAARALPEQQRAEAARAMARLDSVRTASLLEGLGFTNRNLLLQVVHEIAVVNPEGARKFLPTDYLKLTRDELNSIAMDVLARNHNRSNRTVWDEGKLGPIPGAPAGRSLWPEGNAVRDPVPARPIPGKDENFPTVGEAEAQAGGFFIHAIAPYASPGGNQSFLGMPDWRMKLDVLLGARPNLSATHVTPGIDPSEIWDGIGAIIIDGIVTSAGKGGTQSAGIGGRTGAASSRNEVFNGLAENTAGWREAAIANPRVGALFVAIGKDGLAMRPELVQDMMQKAIELHLPLLALKDGQLYQLEYLGADKPLRLGQPVFISQVTARGETIPEPIRRQALNHVQNEAPYIFNELPIEARRMIARMEGQAQFLEIHPDRYSALGPSRDTIPARFEEHLRALDVNPREITWSKRVRNNLYFVVNNELFLFDEHYSSQSREVTATVVRVKTRQRTAEGEYRHLDQPSPAMQRVSPSLAKIPLPETVYLQSDSNYLEDMKGAVSLGSDPEIKIRAAFRLYAYADCAQSAGLDDVARQARTIAGTVLSNDAYQAAKRGGLNADGTIKFELLGIR